MDFPKPALSRRTFLAALAASSSLTPVPGLMTGAAFAQTPRQGGTVITVGWPGPTYLNSGVTTAGPEAFIGPKLFDGLLSYDYGMVPRPALAESFSVTEGGRRVTFNLRAGVKWHDGNPFTSRDVAVTFMEVLKKVHGRGRSLFADLTAVETPDDLTAVFIFARPAPAMFKALDGRESPILPAHLYAGTDVMNNPANLAPVGTGAYRFVSHERGVSVVMERNPDYWDTGLPRLDRIIVQYIADASTRTAMMEAGQINAVFLNFLPPLDTLRLGAMPQFELETKGYETSASSQQIDFNLSHPILRDVRVRHAIAHAIDLKWIVDNIWHGFATAGQSPLHHEQVEFFSTEGVPQYPFDLARANALLDEAGHRRGARNMRFSLTIDPTPLGNESALVAEYMREALRQVGIDLQIRTQDFAIFVRRVWTDRDYDMSVYTAAMGADPTIGVQRFYWTKAISPGVGFSNGSGYSNPEVDALLEATQVEQDFAARKEQFKRFQQIIMRDLPTMPVASTHRVTITRREIRDHTMDAVGPALGNMATAWIQS